MEKSVGSSSRELVRPLFFFWNDFLECLMEVVESRSGPAPEFEFEEEDEG